jgi:hypothetical protein
MYPLLARSSLIILVCLRLTARLTYSTPPFGRPLSLTVSHCQSRATFSFPRPNAPSMSALERKPVSFRRSGLVLLDQPTRISPAEKSRPARLTLGRVLPTSIESHVSVVHSNGRAPTLVLRLSPMALLSGNKLVAISANWTDTETIDLSLPRSITAHLFLGSPVSQRCLTLVLLRARICDQPGLANASARTRHGVHSSRSAFPIRPPCD